MTHVPWRSVWPGFPPYHIRTTTSLCATPSHKRTSRRLALGSLRRGVRDAGLAVLVYDNRNRTAITYASTRPEVDSARIGIWGGSYSGGHVLVVGAIDRRVKCVASQVPLVSGHANFRMLVRADFIAGFQAQFNSDREARFRGQPPRWCRSSTPIRLRRRRSRRRTPTPGRIRARQRPAVDQPHAAADVRRAK
jgi:hypothetical protein